MSDQEKQHFKKGEIVKMIVNIDQKGLPAGTYIRRMKEEPRVYQWFIDNNIISFEKASLAQKEAWNWAAEKLGEDPILTLLKIHNG